VKAHPAVLIVVLVSGRGSNLQALIEAQRRGQLDGGHIRAVVSNRPDAFALQRARRNGIAIEIVDHRAFVDRDTFDRELLARVEAHHPELIVLAGFMRLLTPFFIDRFKGRILNIHPSLLPEFRGLHTHERALEAGVKQHGCSVQFVNEDLDTGPVIIQAKVALHPDDDASRLAARVLRCEHKIYPLAVRWFCEGRLEQVGDQVFLDGAPLREPLMLDEREA
jgi:phosphoribosylglycinamide formyltransferase 1